jgi:LysM repeat protein
MKSRIPGRIFAPLALILTAIAVVVAVSISTGAGGSNSASKTTTATATQQDGKQTGTTAKSKPKVYVVKPGDLLTSIAESTGVPIERIQALNPDLDPQVLIPGQSIKIGP